LIKGNSYFIILAACLLLLMAITSAQNLHMATGIETLVFKDTQVYRDIDYYNRNFQSTTFLILITSDDVLDPQVIDAMARLESQILTNPKVTGVTGLQTFAAQSTDLLSNRADIEQMIEKLPPEISRFLLLDRHHTIMTATLRGDVEEEDQPPVLEDVKNAIRWVPMPPGTSAVVTGSITTIDSATRPMPNNMVKPMLPTGSMER
jgi:predicted RND superfamily exporter protein